MSPLERLWGCGDPDALFHGADRAILPWPRTPRRPGERFSVPPGRPTLTEVDPRLLRASQPWLVRSHVLYYQTGAWELTGVTSADMDSAANRFPVIEVAPDGRMTIRTGHHRSFAAVIEARPLLARVFPPPADAAADDNYVVTPMIRATWWNAARLALADAGLDDEQAADRWSMATTGRTRTAR